MEATIIKIDDKYVELLLKNKTIRVPKSHFKFEYEVGEIIDIHKINGEFIFMKRSFEIPVNQKKHKPSKQRPILKTAKKAIFAVVCFALVAVVPFLLSSTYQDDASNSDPSRPIGFSDEEKLESCLSKTTESELNKKIKCYNKYKLDGYTEKIAELQEQIDAESHQAEEMNQDDEYGLYVEDLERLSQDSSTATPYVNEYEHTPPKSYPQSYTHNFSEPIINEPTPSTPTMTCEDYYEQYHTEYITQRNQTISQYNSSISSARNSCNSFGGCPTASSLERQRDRELTSLENSYKANMQSVGCEP